MAITRAQRALIVAIALLGVVVAAWAAWQRPAESHRPRYILINETAQHDHDLAFRMSLKLAEKQSGIENALVLLASLPPSKTIEQTAVELFNRLRIKISQHPAGNFRQAGVVGRNGRHATSHSFHHGQAKPLVE